MHLEYLLTVLVTFVGEGTAKPFPRTSRRYGLKRVRGPEGISLIVCLELDFNTRGWKGFIINDNASEINKHNLWNLHLM